MAVVNTIFLFYLSTVPEGCAESAWPVEYVPGYKLLAEQHTVLPNVADKSVTISLYEQFTQHANARGSLNYVYTSSMKHVEHIVSFT